jgi:hypothetical protein
VVSSVRAGARHHDALSPRVGSPGVTWDYQRFSRPSPFHPLLRIALDTPETARSSIHGPLRAMARPGLEPGTPRFSVVVQNLSNIGGIPANTPVCAGRWRSANRRKLRLFIAGLGTGTRSGAQSGPLCLGRCACDGWAPTRVNQTATASRRSRMRRWRAGFSTSAARIRADSRALPSPRSARSR